MGTQTVDANHPKPMKIPKSVIDLILNRKILSPLLKLLERSLTHGFWIHTALIPSEIRTTLFIDIQKSSHPTSSPTWTTLKDGCSCWSNPFQTTVNQAFNAFFQLSKTARNRQVLVNRVL